MNRGATFEEILDEIRNDSVNSDYNNHPKRIHMITKSDLTNIVKEFKISFKERLAKDSTSIQSLVHDCEKNFEEDNPIKLFKPQNIDAIEGMKGANSEDFVLIIMTSVQKQVIFSYFFFPLQWILGNSNFDILIFVDVNAVRIQSNLYRQHTWNERI